MAAKRRTRTFATAPAVSVLEQCRRLPGTLRNVCQQAARNRYDRHYHPTNPRRRQHILVDSAMAAGLLISLASVVFITFFYQRAVQREQIVMDLQVSQAAIASGDSVEARLEVRNNGSQALTDAYVTVPAASGFVLAHTTPAQDAEGRIMLGTIRGRDAATVTFSGIAIAEVGAAARVNAVLHYRFAGFGAVQEKVISQAIRLEGSRLSLRLDLPESLAQNKVFPFHIAIHNASVSNRFENLILVADVPPGWETIDASRVVDPALGSWAIDSIGSLETVEITGHARLTGAAKPEAAKVNLKLYAAPLGVPYLQAEMKQEVRVFSPNVVVQTSRLPEFVRLGERAEVSVRVQNAERASLPSARLHVHTQPALLDLSAYGDTVSADGTLEFPLGDIEPSAEVQKTIFLHVRPAINPAEAFGSGAVGFLWRAELHYGSDQEDQWVTVPFEEVLLPIESDLSVQAIARFASAEGESIGTGPWPPRIGETTSVWIFFSPRNTLNPIENATVRFTLAPGVQPTGRQSVTAGQALSLTEDGQGVWEIGVLPDYKTSFEKQGYSAALELSFEGSDVEQQVLVQDISISGDDQTSRTSIQATAPDILVTNVLAK